MKEELTKKIEYYNIINDICSKNEIVIFGSTKMANFPFYELINKSNLNQAIYNRSIDGLTISDAYSVIENCVINLSPKKVFISLGENDELNENDFITYKKIVNLILHNVKNVSVYILSLTEKSDKDKEFNQKLKTLKNDKTVKYIDINSVAEDDKNYIKSVFKRLCVFFRNSSPNLSDVFSSYNL